MAFAIEWDLVGEKFFEIGVDHGVLYKMASAQYPKGVVWNGLINVTENASGGEATKLYADNIPYLTLRSAEEFGLTIECYAYPDEFKECDGSVEVTPGLTIGQQPRKNFGFSYRTKIGNDVDNDAHGYKIHLVYGCSVSPSEKAYQTKNDSPDAITFSYEATSNPVNVPGNDPASVLTIDSTAMPSAALEAIEKILYGTAAEGSTPAVEARLPLPEEIIQIIEDAGASNATMFTQNY